MSAEGIPKSQFKNLDWTGGVVSQPAGDSNAAKKTAPIEQTAATGQQTATTGQGGTTGSTPPPAELLQEGVGKKLNIQKC